MNAVTVRVPAKINLALSVGAPRKDGFHELATLFCAVSLYDSVTIEHCAGGPAVVVKGPHAAGVPVDGRNLAVRAACLLAADTHHDPAVRLTLHKGIPVAGGMAGGSADAAGALVAAAALWGEQLEPSRLSALAAQLGSDVPFPLLGGMAVGESRGERLTPVRSGGPFWWVVATVPGGLSTPAVFGRHDSLQDEQTVAPSRPRLPEGLLAAVETGDAAALAAVLCNDLQSAACSLRPDLRDVLAYGRGVGALASLLSGSGPTCLFLAEGSAHAAELSALINASPHVAETHVVRGPVPGAHVIAPEDAARVDLDNDAGSLAY